MVNSLLLTKQIAALQKVFRNKRSQIETLIKKNGAPFYLYDQQLAKTTIKNFLTALNQGQHNFQTFYKPSTH